MDGEKRKRGDIDGEVDEKRRTRASEDNGVKEEPDDEEVEEFFAILRRIRVAVEYFEKGGNSRAGRRRELTAMESPSFERRDFQEVNGPVKGPGDHQEEQGDTGLDLNADPAVSEPSLVGEPVVL